MERRLIQVLSTKVRSSLILGLPLRKIVHKFSSKINPELGMSLHCGGILWVPYGGHFLQVECIF